MSLLTYIASTHRVVSNVQKTPVFDNYQYMSPDFLDDLAELWQKAYRNQFETDSKGALLEWKATFAGNYGELYFAASPMIFEKKKLIAAVATVTIAPWLDTPACPFIIDLMVEPNHRRKSLGSWLLKKTAELCLKERHEHIALRVHPNNEPALSLYQKLGFHLWDQKLASRHG